MQAFPRTLAVLVSVNQMKNYNRASIQQGDAIRKRMAREGVIAKESGSAFSMPNNEALDQESTGMNGLDGPVARRMAGDPEFRGKVMSWGDLFSRSREGMDFYDLYNNDEGGVA